MATSLGNKFAARRWHKHGNPTLRAAPEPCRDINTGSYGAVALAVDRTTNEQASAIGTRITACCCHADITKGSAFLSRLMSIICCVPRLTHSRAGCHQAHGARQQDHQIRGAGTHQPQPPAASAHRAGEHRVTGVSAGKCTAAATRNSLYAKHVCMQVMYACMQSKRSLPDSISLLRSSGRCF